MKNQLRWLLQLRSSGFLDHFPTGHWQARKTYRCIANCATLCCQVKDFSFFGRPHELLIPSQVISHKTTWHLLKRSTWGQEQGQKDTRIRNCVKNPPRHHLRQDGNRWWRRGFPEHFSFLKNIQRSHCNCCNKLLKSSQPIKTTQDNNCHRFFKGIWVSKSTQLNFLVEAGVHPRFGCSG